MSKMGSHDPFGHLKHKLWAKERPGVKLAIWLPTTKIQESPQFPCVKVTCNILLKKFWRGYNFVLDLISIGGLHTKLWAPKVVGVPSLGKCHLDVGLVERHKVYYKGEGGVAFPKSRPWWIWICLWLILALKVLQLCINQLVVWFVQVRVND
jgi:hypothetical protein